MEKICRCGRTHDRDSEDCFGCHVKGISFTFVGGGGYGRRNFHERTNAQAIREITGGRKDVEPVGRTPYYGPST